MSNDGSRGDDPRYMTVWSISLIGNILAIYSKHMENVLAASPSKFGSRKDVIKYRKKLSEFDSFYIFSNIYIESGIAPDTYLQAMGRQKKINGEITQNSLVTAIAKTPREVNNLQYHASVVTKAGECFDLLHINDEKANRKIITPTIRFEKFMHEFSADLVALVRASNSVDDKEP